MKKNGKAPVVAAALCGLLLALYGAAARGEIHRVKDFNMKKGIKIILMSVLAIVAVFAAYKAVSIGLDYQKGQEIYTGLKDTVVSQATPAPTPSAAPEVSAPANFEDDTPPEITVDFSRLKALNPDICGWLYVPGTEISYPVLQGGDNDKYLNTSYDGQKVSCGSIFMEALCDRDWSGENTIIYGHNMKNGTMFGTLDGYLEQAYADSHPYMYVLTETGYFKYQLFASHVAYVDDGTYIVRFSSGENKQSYLYSISNSSAVTSMVEVTAADRLLMLSTCTSVTRDERMVVHAVLLGEVKY